MRTTEEPRPGQVSEPTPNSTRLGDIAAGSQAESSEIRRTRRSPVSGDSMTDAAVCDGDVATVRRQDSADHGGIVAALPEKGARVKVVRRQDGQV
ncbi:LexA family protein [Streptomyces sp. NPDC087903]|uniref:LexA family protein n=1 Tax=Streptomyces sp. NPDC087903 TaxID=3365819 RepID=UPI003806D226